MEVSTGSGSDRVAAFSISISILRSTTRSLPLPVLTSLFVEVNLRRLPGSFFRLEVRLFFETHQAGD